MGVRIDPHEIYLGSFFELFNNRFGPSFPVDDISAWLSGGIMEIAALQREFEIFRPGRPFVKSAALLGLTGSGYGPPKERWVAYLEKLPKMNSDQAGVTGDERIVEALVENFRRPTGPLPCLLQPHDGRMVAPGLVTVSQERPLFYLESVEFLLIRLPMRPSGGPGEATGFGKPTTPPPTGPERPVSPPTQRKPPRRNPKPKA